MSPSVQGQQPVTGWFAWDHRRHGFAFNHSEMGHAETDTPADPFKHRWSRNRWERRHGRLEGSGRFGASVLHLDGPAVALLLPTSEG